MAQIGALLVRKDGSDTTWPIYALGDSSGEPTIFECVKVYTPSGVGFCPVTDDSGAADMGFIKVVNDAGAVLYGNSTPTFPPSYDVIEDWSSGTWLNNYSLQYSSGGFNRVLSPVSISPDSIESQTATTASAYSFAGDGLPYYVTTGQNLEIDMYFGTGSTGYLLLYFGVQGTGGQQNYAGFYRNDTGTNNLALRVDNRGGGGSLSTLAQTSVTRHTSEWLTLKIEFGAGSKTVSLIRKSDSSTVGSVTASNTTFDAQTGVGLSLKGPDVYLNTMRRS
tara:strand:- start:483 stop:1316 length:834 start_codon:yes stop_codon:yes gene_type:complete